MLDSLVLAKKQITNLSICGIIIENGFMTPPAWLSEVCTQHNFKIILPGKNLGFGTAHNIGLKVNSDYHLIVNADVILDVNSLKKAISFMEKNENCGLLSPLAHWEDGKRQYLCKRMPKLFDLLLRGFAPAKIKSLFKNRLDHYEMADVTNESDIYWNPPIVSGCFMFFRTNVWKETNGFDPKFFLYFEDFDLSLRTRKISDIAYVPQVRIVHHGGNAAKKGYKHITMFVSSMIYFFVKKKCI